jgi:hypothetical protein
MGKIITILLLAAIAIAGGSMYYLQVYGFYDPVPVQPGSDVKLVSQETGAPVAITYSDFQGIDADSSPIRYRACFTTSDSPEMLTESYVEIKGFMPRTGPGWFDCFDAKTIDDALKAGTALTFLGAKNIHFGVDRIVAITNDGRGYVWHELNECGKKSYDGTVVGEACPALDTAGTND